MPVLRSARALAVTNDTTVEKLHDRLFVKRLQDQLAVVTFAFSALSDSIWAFSPL